MGSVTAASGTTTVRYWAAARDAAGVASEESSSGTLGEALRQARSVRDERFGRVLSVCSYLVDGEPVGARDHDAVVLVAGGVVDVLPPFAGG